VPLNKLMRLKHIKNLFEIESFGTPQLDTQLALAVADERVVLFRIERINALRLRIMGYIAIVLELLLILFYDLPNLANTESQMELSLAYLSAHLFLMIISIAVVIAVQISISKNKDLDFMYLKWVSAIFGMLFLSGVAFITGLDQSVNDQIVSFIAMFAIGSTLYYCKPSRQLFVFGIPIAFFVIFVWYFQEDPAIASVNIINGLLFNVTMMVISVFNYNRAKSEISKGILLEAWTEKLDFLAHHDSLTGLYNRRHFEREVFKMMEDIDQQDHLALGIMDLDDFKKVNDSFGHDRADDVLIRVAEIMKQSIEPSGIVARWGGEEFIFMLQGTTFEALIEKVESLRMAIASEAIVIADQTIQVTGSFGITEVLWDGGNQLKESFTLVDAALYESKEAGKNLVTVKLG